MSELFSDLTEEPNKVADMSNIIYEFFHLSSLFNDTRNKFSFHEISDNFQKKGWIKISIESLLSERSRILKQWELIFQNGFNLESNLKIKSGIYTECGVSVGYRSDLEREFFETRITSGGSCEPSFISIKDYNDLVVEIYQILNKVAITIFNMIGNVLGIDPEFFIDLTDINSNGVLPFLNEDEQYSSSLLRICNYNTNNDDNKLAFGKSNLICIYIIYTYVCIYTYIPVYM